ncbi:MAG: tRNA pseudouridine(38-40) synthase TruA [Chlamydiales bacterium]|nr:tRNA pseudouridine(38-40) synthase TruA [Chlamydiales bacterium]
MSDTHSYRYKILIAYDGTNYGGWQCQPNSSTIQEHLEKSIQVLLKNPIKVTGSGRTDAGVHANAQIAHFNHDQNIDPTKFLFGMNGLLPNDIRIKSIEAVSPSFHARFSAKKKIYRYYIKINRFYDPFDRLYSYLMTKPLDIDAMKLAANKFIGTHDFKSFANESNDGSAGKNSVRTIYDIRFLQEGDKLCLEFIGNGFLYKMVRNIVGALVDIGLKKMDIDYIDHIFAARDRRYAGNVAPAKGLFLQEVIYEENLCK